MAVTFNLLQINLKTQTLQLLSTVLLLRWSDSSQVMRYVKFLTFEDDPDTDRTSADRA